MNAGQSPNFHVFPWKALACFRQVVSRRLEKASSGKLDKQCGGGWVWVILAKTVLVLIALKDRVSLSNRR